MMRERRTVAVTGVGGGVGQAILRAIKHASFSCRTLGLDMNPRGAGLYQCNDAIVLPPCGHAEYLPSLAEVLSAHQVDVLIPGSDPELPVLAGAKAELETSGTRILVGGLESVTISRDKLECARFFRARDLPFVQTVPVRQAASLAEAVGYPLIVKPLGGSASRGAAMVFEPKDLTPHLHKEDFIAQEFAMPAAWREALAAKGADAVFPGKSLRQEEEISIQVVLDHEAAHLGTFCSVNRLQTGTPIYVDPRRIPEVEEMVERMAAALIAVGLVGPCNFQCRLTPEGPRVFEVNPRFTGITGVRAAMGFNEVEAVVGRLLGTHSVEEAQDLLHQPSDVVASRYVDEIIIPRDDLRAAGE